MATESVAEEVTREQIAAMDFPALLTDDDVKELEKINRTWGPSRRIALAVLARSKQQLLEPFELDAEEAADALIGIRDQCIEYRAHLQSMVEQADTARARLEAVMQTVIHRHGENQ